MKRFAVLLILSAAFLPACASTKWDRKTVVKQRYFNVTLEQRLGNGKNISSKYEHPYEIDLADLKKLLGDLTYAKKVGLLNTKKQSPVFQAVEIERLAPALANTLAKADPRQRIRFTSFNQGKTMMFSISRKTEGVLFIDPDRRLNIAFNFINLDRPSSETTAIYPNYSNVDPLKIITSDTAISPNAPYVKLHKFETGEDAPMWVEAELLRQQETISTETVPTARVTEEVSPAVVPITEKIAPPVEKPVEKAAPAPVSDDVLEKDLKEEIKNKLKYLKELLNEGLISEKDYNVKKMQLLDKIN